MKSDRIFTRFLIGAIALCVSLCAARPALALMPDEILLIVNKNSPDSMNLAKLYCQLRNVPTDQIVQLDLPNDEEMSFETYETNVIGPTRQFLNDHQLKPKIKCLLTFYGVPFRVLAKKNTPADDRELAELKDVEDSVGKELWGTVRNLEKLASSLDINFTPSKADTIADLLTRAQTAIAAVTGKVASLPDEKQRGDIVTQLVAALQQIGGEAELDNRLGRTQRSDTTKPPEVRQKWQQIHQDVEKAREQLQKLQSTRWDAGARSELREVARAHFGAIGLIRVLDAQINYLTVQETASATDNELPFLWDDYYPRQHWLKNPMNVAVGDKMTNALMVMRLDGPDPTIVERMMKTSVEVEKTGLTGTIAIDARGIAPIDDKGNLSAYGEYDETLRNLAAIVRTRTQLKLALDDQDIVFPPHFVKNVACYVGWYSVQNYIPGCDFNPGAVGFHIASYELVTLHSPSARWVRGLLTDGVVATLGPVAEPTLSAFPKADEFFPLLFTGKLTMAEVYWKTNPMTSWMITFIGDPLYTPYKEHPALAVEDLPPGLRKALK